MNFNLTTLCNNHCYYCFQSETIIKKEEMLFEDFKNILFKNKIFLKENKQLITLLGGEPTLYSHFLELINFLKENSNFNTEILLITNCLGSNQIFKELNTNNYFFNYLINTSYDDNKENIFFNNLSLLTDYEKICLSITLTSNTILNKKYINRLKTIFLNFPNIKRLRIGLYMPNPIEQDISIYNYDNDLLYLFEILKDTSLETISFDCTVNFCQISYNFFYKYIYPAFFSKTLYNNRYILNYFNYDYCPGACVDILPNLDLKYCSSTEKNSFNIGNFKTYNLDFFVVRQKLETLNFQYQIKSNQCTQCELYSKKICMPCHAFDQAFIRKEIDKK